MAVAEFQGQMYDRNDLSNFGDNCNVQKVSVDKVGWMG